MPRFAVLCLLLGLPVGLGGCALVDQASFNPSLRPRVAAAHPAPAVPVEPNGALLTILLSGGQPDYQDAVAGAVKQALAIKPDVVFDVISMVPEKRGTPPSWQDAERITVWGRRIADQIQQDGVDQGQIHLGLRATPGLDHGEIKVYVR